MKKPVQIEPEAEEELGEAAAWYEQRRVGLGQALLDAVQEALVQLQEFPSSGAPVPALSADIPARHLQLRRFPYAVVLLELPDRISVIAVAHNRRRPGYWRKRRIQST